MLLFLFYPTSSDTISLVTGIDRLVFTVAAVLICFGFFKMSVRLNDVVHKPLSTLGEASYSVYLLHPVIYGIGNWFFAKFADHVYNFPWYLVYQYFEKYFMSKGAE